MLYKSQNFQLFVTLNSLLWAVNHLFGHCLKIWTSVHEFRTVLNDQTWEWSHTSMLHNWAHSVAEAILIELSSCATSSIYKPPVNSCFISWPHIQPSTPNAWHSYNTLNAEYLSLCSYKTAVIPTLVRWEDVYWDMGMEGGRNEVQIYPSCWRNWD